MEIFRHGICPEHVAEVAFVSSPPRANKFAVSRSNHAHRCGISLLNNRPTIKWGSRRMGYAIRFSGGGMREVMYGKIQTYPRL